MLLRSWKLHPLPPPAGDNELSTFTRESTQFWMLNRYYIIKLKRACSQGEEMSHFTTVKTVVRDKAILCETLRKLKYEFQVGEYLPIRGYQGQNTFGHIVINTGSEYDIGFQRQKDGSFHVCTDWWGIEGTTGIRQEDFLHALNQNYSHIAIKKQVQEQGYIIEKEQVNENGEIELVVCEPL